MKIQTAAHNIELTDVITTYLEKKINSLEKLLPNDRAIADVVIGKASNHHQTGDIFTTEVNLNSGGLQFYAKSEEESVFASIDIVKDELSRELRKSKTRRETLWKRGSRKVKDIIRGLKF